MANLTSKEWISTFLSSPRQNWPIWVIQRNFLEGQISAGNDLSSCIFKPHLMHRLTHFGAHRECSERKACMYEWRNRWRLLASSFVATESERQVKIMQLKTNSRRSEIEPSLSDFYDAFLSTVGSPTIRLRRVVLYLSNVWHNFVEASLTK